MFLSSCSEYLFHRYYELWKKIDRSLGIFPLDPKKKKNKPFSVKKIFPGKILSHPYYSIMTHIDLIMLELALFSEQCCMARYSDMALKTVINLPLGISIVLITMVYIS